jgi:hypothetical protein
VQLKLLELMDKGRQGHVWIWMVAATAAIEVVVISLIPLLQLYCKMHNSIGISLAKLQSFSRVKGSGRFSQSFAPSLVKQYSLNIM